MPSQHLRKVNQPGLPNELQLLDEEGISWVFFAQNRVKIM